MQGSRTWRLFNAGLPGLPQCSASSQPSANTSSTVAAVGVERIGLEIARLGTVAHDLVAGSISESSRRTYRSAQTRYVNFCTGLQFPPLPASEQLLILFTAELLQTVASYSMRVYLSAAHHFHLENGWGNPLKDTAQLDLLSRGAKRQKPPSNDQRLPVTPLILRMIRKELEKAPRSTVMLYCNVVMSLLCNHNLIVLPMCS